MSAMPQSSNEDAVPESQAAIEPEEADTPHQESRGRRFWLVFPGLCFSILLAALDTSVVATALPTIMYDLKSESLFIWVINGYFVGISAVQPMYGQAADIFGRRWPMIISVVLFALGSGICGGASSIVMLIVGRIVQGFGAGGIFSMVSIIVADLVPLRERQKYMAITQSFFALGTFIGPIVGGAIVTHASWRWVFYINLPVAGIALILLFFFLQLNYVREGTVYDRLGRVDFTGQSILIASIMSILVPLTWGGTTYSWSSPRVLTPLLIGFAGVLAFGVYEVFVAKDLASIPPRLFRNSVSIIGYIMTFLHGTAMAWLSFFLPVYFQVLLEVSPLTSGIYLLAIVIPLMPAGILGGFVTSSTGRYKPVLILGWVLLALGSGLLTLLDSTSSPARWITFQILAGLGGGIILTTTIPAIQASLPESDVALATSTWAFLRSLGTIWGGAIPAAVFNSRFDQLAYRILDPVVQARLRNGGAYQTATAKAMQALDAFPETKSQVVGVYTEALQMVWLILIVFTVVGFPLAVVIKELELRKTLDTKFGLKVEEKKGDVEGQGLEVAAGSVNAEAEKTPVSDDASSAKSAK